MGSPTTSEALFTDIRRRIDSEITHFPQQEKIPLFYDPIHYINSLSGKKLRPLLSVLCGLTVGGEMSHLIPAAAALELLHNFSLVHDDIMDQDATRRGQPTVHVRWDIATAILAGDGLLGLAYRKLLETPNIRDTRLAKLFTEAMIEICEGQALDKIFETREFVEESDYLQMISRKTARLIRLSCEIGAIVGEAQPEQINALAEFGFKIGMGFQIQDDLLDIIADESKLGKKVGSDLAMNKKTIAIIRLQKRRPEIVGPQTDIESYRRELDHLGIVSEISSMAEQYFDEAREKLQLLPDNIYRRHLSDLAEYIQNREK